MQLACEHNVKIWLESRSPQAQEATLGRKRKIRRTPACRMRVVCLWRCSGARIPAAQGINSGFREQHLLLFTFMTGRPMYPAACKDSADVRTGRQESTTKEQDQENPCLPQEGVLPVALQLRGVQLSQRLQRVAGALHQQILQGSNEPYWFH